MRSFQVRSRITFLATSILLAMCWSAPARAQDVFALPDARAGATYEAQKLNMDGGILPLHWQIAGGEFPEGLRLSAGGVIEGTPAAARATPYEFSIQVSDSSTPAQNVTIRFSLRVQAAPLRFVNVTAKPNVLRFGGVQAISAKAREAVSENSDARPAANSAKGASVSPANSGPKRVAGTQTSSAPAPQAPSAAPQAPAASAPGTCTANVKPIIDKPVLVGDSQLSGHVTDGAKWVVATVKDTTGAGEVIEMVTRAGVKTDHTFTVDFGEGLRAGQSVTVEEFCNQSGATIAQTVRATNYKEDGNFDWGRIRYYLSAGTMFSKENDEFSKQSLYLGLNFDNNWWQKSSFALNTYFDARLTSIPVSASATPPAGTTAIDTFIGSRKAALMQGGIYAPVYVSSWKWWHDGNKNAFMFAPILKGGFLTLISGTQNIQTPTPASTGTRSTTLNNQDFYHFYAGGVRLGHQVIYKSWNIAPELLSYLDLTLGRWENFSWCVNPCPIDPVTLKPTGRVFMPTMMGLEGRLKIPKLPVQIGFDAITPIRGAGRGDLRFLFGTSFDIGCLFQKLQFKPATDSQNAPKGCGPESPSAGSKGTGTP